MGKCGGANQKRNERGWCFCFFVLFGKVLCLLKMKLALIVILYIDAVMLFSYV